MKKIIFILLCVFQLNSAIVEALSINRPLYSINRFMLGPKMAEILMEKGREHIERLGRYNEEVEAFWDSAKAAAKKWWADMPDWEDNFTVDNGSASIYHDKNGIGIVSNLVRSFDQNDDVEFSPYQNPVKELYLTQWRDRPFKYPLRLKWHSSRNDFVIELIRCGLYKGTEEEQRMYEKSGNWHGHHTVVNLFFDVVDKQERKRSVECRSIEHDRMGIILLDDLSNRIMQPLIAVGLTRSDERKLHLHYQLSYYEFMMRLIETGHISFMEYPPYTFQERLKVDRKERESRYYECYYYGPLKVSDGPLYKKKLEKEQTVRLKREEQEGL